MAEGAPADKLLEARSLCVEFPRPDGSVLRAVHGFGLSVGAGEFVGVLGKPGCGKSTAALALMGLVRAPGRITGGQVRFMGRDLLALPEGERAAVRGRDIGIIVQNPRTALHPLLDVGTQIANVYRAHNKASAREAALHAVDMLRSVGINDPQRRARAFPHELSTGMTQRVLIAMALSSRPRLLIADEPTSGLDVTIQTQFLDGMWEAAQRTGSAVLLVTQNLGIVANYCDRVVVMNASAVVEEAPVRRFFEAPQHEYSRRVVALSRMGAEDAARSDEVPADAPPLIEVRGLVKNFPVRGTRKVVHAVDGVSFAVRPGECVGLVGESGSGKTTTGRVMLRLLPATAGDVRFHGEPVLSKPERAFRALRGKLQIVFQDPFDAMNPRWTVRDVIGELLSLHSNLDAHGREARIDELLGLVGLDPAVKPVRPVQLSAGRQQRVAVARAIAAGPEFVVLDEPTSALTAETTAEIIALLMDLSRRLGLAYLFISHDLTTVRHICHRVAVMYLGQVVEWGTKEQVFGAPLHPYSQALLAAHLFPDLAHRRVDGERPAGLRGEIPSPVDLPPGCYLHGRCPRQLDRCAAERQELRTLPDGRAVRCWRAEAGETAAPLPAAAEAVSA